MAIIFSVSAKTRIRNFSVLVLIVFYFNTCATRSAVGVGTYRKIKPSSIVFYDVTNESRKDIAIQISRALAYGARVIGLMPMFQTWNGSIEDSTFLKTIKDDRVNFASYTQTNEGGGFRIISSNKIFIHPRITNEGTIAFFANKDSTVSQFIPLVSDSERQQSVAFAYLLAEKYDETVYDRFGDFIPNKGVDIPIQLNIDDFSLLEKNFTQSQVQNKVVIFEALERSKSEMELYTIIKGKKVKTNVAALTASIILYFLNE